MPMPSALTQIRRICLSTNNPIAEVVGGVLKLAACGGWRKNRKAIPRSKSEAASGQTTDTSMAHGSGPALERDVSWAQAKLTKIRDQIPHSVTTRTWSPKKSSLLARGREQAERAGRAGDAPRWKTVTCPCHQT